MKYVFEQSKNGNLFSLTIDKTLYSQEVISNSLYLMAGRFFVTQESGTEPNSVIVKFLCKSLTDTLSEEECYELSGKFMQELLDQQVRLDLENRFGHIRELIIAQAFKPVS